MQKRQRRASRKRRCRGVGPHSRRSNARAPRLGARSLGWVLTRDPRARKWCSAALSSSGPLLISTRPYMFGGSRDCRTGRGFSRDLGGYSDSALWGHDSVGPGSLDAGRRVGSACCDGWNATNFSICIAGKLTVPLRHSTLLTVQMLRFILAA